MMNETASDFLHSYSKFFVWSFKQKKYKLIHTTNGLYAVNNSKSTPFALFFSFIFVMWIVVGTSMMVQELKSPDVDFTIFGVLAPVYIMGIIGLRQFLWLINGRQELTIEKGCLTLRKKGIFFTKEKNYDLSTISKIRANFFEEDLSTVEKLQANIRIARATITSQIIGSVLFTYKYDTIKVFNDLSSDEKRELITEITKFQEKKDVQS